MSWCKVAVLTSPVESVAVMIWLALQDNGCTSVGMFNAGWLDLLACWFIFDRQHIFRFKLLAIVRVANANVTSGILILHIRYVQSVALLLHTKYKTHQNFMKSLQNPHFRCPKIHTLKLYGKLRPPARVHVTGAPFSEVDVQSTTIESPCRSTE